jgi:hypothetical protein
MAEKSGLKPKTILTRLRTLGIKPTTKEAIYPPDTLEKVLSAHGPGRPSKKPKPGETEASNDAPLPQR